MTYKKLDFLLPSWHHVNHSSGCRALPLCSFFEAAKYRGKREEEEGKDEEGRGRHAKRPSAQGSTRADGRVPAREPEPRPVRRGLQGRSHYRTSAQVEPLSVGALLVAGDPHSAAVADSVLGANASRRSTRVSPGDRGELRVVLPEVQGPLERLLHGAPRSLHRARCAQSTEALLPGVGAPLEEVLRCRRDRWLSPRQDRATVEDLARRERGGAAGLSSGGLRSLPRDCYPALVRSGCGGGRVHQSTDGHRLPSRGHLGPGRPPVLLGSGFSWLGGERLLRLDSVCEEHLDQESPPAESHSKRKGPDRGLVGRGRAQRRIHGPASHRAQKRWEDLQSSHQRHGPQSSQRRGHCGALSCALDGRTAFFPAQGGPQPQEAARRQPECGGYASLCRSDGACCISNSAGGHCAEVGPRSRRAISPKALSSPRLDLDQATRGRVHLRSHLHSKSSRQTEKTQLEKSSRHCGLASPPTRSKA